MIRYVIAFVPVISGRPYAIHFFRLKDGFPTPKLEDAKLFRYRGDAISQSTGFYVNKWWFPEIRIVDVGDAGVRTLRPRPPEKKPGKTIEV